MIEDECRKGFPGRKRGILRPSAPCGPQQLTKIQPSHVQNPHQKQQSQVEDQVRMRITENLTCRTAGNRAELQLRRGGERQGHLPWPLRCRLTFVHNHQERS